MIVRADNAVMLSHGELDQRFRGNLLTDSEAISIAVQWQSPGTTGQYLAELASTHKASSGELQDDIIRTIRECGVAGTWDDLSDLMDLYAWVTSKNPEGV